MALEGGSWGGGLSFIAASVNLRREKDQPTMEGGGRVSWMKCGSLLSLLVLLLALWFRSPQNAVLDDRLDAVLSSLLRAERKVGINTVARPRVAIGKCKCCELAVNYTKQFTLFLLASLRSKLMTFVIGFSYSKMGFYIK